MNKIIYKNESDWTDEVTARFWDYKVTENHPYFTEEVGKGIIKLVKSKLNLSGDILDYGCGNGTMIHYLAKENEDNSISGLDFSHESVTASMKKNSGLSNVKKIIHFSELNTHFKENSFDVVLLIETIEHLRSDLLNDTLHTIYKLLKPGGHLVVTTPFDEDLKANSIYCPFCNAAHHHMQHVQSFTIDRLSSIFHSHNFKTVDVMNTDFLYYENKLAYYKIHVKWWLKYQLGVSKRLPFQKKHLYGIAQKV